MTDGKAPVRTIRSASAEAAAMTETPKTRSIQSASDEGKAKADHHGAGQSHDRTAPTSFGPAAQAGREFIKQATDRPAQQLAAAGEATGRTVQGMTRQADRSLTTAVGFGTVMASNYGAACTEVVKHMQRATERQRDMMNDMLRARSPSDVLLAGNRYLLGGMQAFFDTNARIARAASRKPDDAGQTQSRHAG